MTHITRPRRVTQKLAQMYRRLQQTLPEASVLQKSRTSDGPISVLQVIFVPLKHCSWRSLASYTRVRIAVELSALCLSANFS